jgi:hypothetical protein
MRALSVLYSTRWSKVWCHSFLDQWGTRFVRLPQRGLGAQDVLDDRLDVEYHSVRISRPCYFISRNDVLL